MERSLFCEDSAAHQVAEALGFELVVRFQKIEVFDEVALKAAGFLSTKPKPDYARISKALNDGQLVDGARWRATEYVLRPRETE